MGNIYNNFISTNVLFVKIYRYIDTELCNNLCSKLRF